MTPSGSTPNGSLSPMGVMPRQRPEVVGLFRMGLYEVVPDRASSIDTGMLLAGTDRVDHIEVKVANV